MTNELKVRPLVFNDLFNIAPIFRKLNGVIDIEGYKKDESKLDENGNPTLIPLSEAEYKNKLVFQLVGNLDLVKDEIYELMASLTNKTPEEVGQFGITDILAVFNGLLGDKELPVFLNQAKNLA